MRASPAPAGDPHPVVLSELPADPGGGRTLPIQNGTDPHPVVLSELPADPGGGRILPIQNGTDATNQDGLESPSRFPAAILLFTHMVELATILVATLIQAFPLPSHKLSHQEGQVVPSRIDDIALFMKILFGSLPLLLITIISLVWVMRAQDFSGRGAARFMCWLLHLLQASLIWRYLKVHIVYDPSDVVELGTLRFVQVHLHTLPFLVVHMYLTLNVVGSVGLISILLATILVISAVVGIVVATTRARENLPRESSLSPPTITQVCHLLYDNPETYEQKKKHDIAAQVVVCITSACVLWSRAMAVAMLFSLHITWATVIIVLHWIAAIVWVTHQDVLENQNLNPARKVLRRAFLAYLLLWDWHVFRDDATAFTVCARPKFPASYYTITACQNLAVTIAWFMTDKIVSPPLRTTALSSVVLAQIVALLLLTLSYLYISSLLPELPHTVKADIITCLVKTPEQDVPTPPLSPSPLKQCPSYIDFKDLEDETVVKQEAKLETPTRNLPPIAHSTPRGQNPLPLAPRLLSRHLPPTMFTYSPDLLPQQHTKSDHSSTDYGSFNSRNTNTVPTQIPPDYDLLQRTHGSFSDSFSSLSCGTVNQNGMVPRTASKQKDATESQHSSVPPTQMSPPTHTTCRSGFCHCRIFDVLERPCAENNEIKEKNFSSKQSILSKTKVVEIKSCNKSAVDVYCTAPRVAVVRGAQRFRVVCASCLHTHDPLLTMCHVKSPPNLPQPMTISTISTPLPISRSCHGLGGCSSTDYPSDTEVTATFDTLSSASADSHSTYTTWPVGRGPGMARLLQLHPGSHDYVTAWLRHQQSRGPKLPSNHSDQLSNTYDSSISNSVPDVQVRKPRRTKRIPSRSACLKTPPLSYLKQDIETIV